MQSQLPALKKIKEKKGADILLSLSSQRVSEHLEKIIKETLLSAQLIFLRTK